GQLSTFILMTLVDKDKYGYEIIDEVLQTTNGKISIKQPSLYSSLKRMEEQSLISSYWRDSEIGGRRHYYHLTDLGKKHLEKWKIDLPTLANNQPEQTNNFSTHSNDNSFRNDQATNVLQQENLFNLSKPEVTPDNNVIYEQKQNDSFIQFDLFSNNNTIVTPIAEEPTTACNSPERVVENNVSQTNNLTDNTVQQNQNSNITQNPIMTSYEKQDVATEKISSFDFLKKSNKSFTDNAKTVVDYEKKYAEKQEHAHINEAYSQTQNVITNNTMSVAEPKVNNEFDTIIPQNTTSQQTNSDTAQQNKASKISLNDLPGYLPREIAEEEKREVETVETKELNSFVSLDSDNFEQTETNDIVQETNLDQTFERNFPTLDDEPNTQPQNIATNSAAEKPKDDGVLITERLEPSDMPKPAKWDKQSQLKEYIQENNPAPPLKSNFKDKNNDPIKDLYEKSKAHIESSEIELIDSKIKYSNYEQLQEFYAEQNIKFKPYKKVVKKSQTDYNMVRISKLNMLTALAILIYTCCTSLIFGICYNFVANAKLNHPLTFIIFPAIALVLFIFALMQYLRTPFNRISYDREKYKFNLKICLICLAIIPILFALCLILGFNGANFVEFSLILLYPTFIALVYFVRYFTIKILLKSNKIY
ncbi:MAG: hypothetical protein E7378_02045, partial [Clostridiales bacterium]|nr:hypothetical protein [Clostridiales bacterium]